MLAQTHIKQQLDALRHGNASGFVRLRVAIEVSSFLGWLAAQTLYPRIYWHARGQERPEYVALGCLRELTEPQAIRQVCEQTSQPHDDSPRYYGGLAFDPTQPGWQGFGPCRFVLPRIELVRRGECVTLCLNLWLPEQTGSDAFEVELQAAAAALDALRPEAPLPPLTRHSWQREDCPSQPQWQTLVEQVTAPEFQAHTPKVVLSRQSRLTHDGATLTADPQAVAPWSLLASWAQHGQDCFHFGFQFSPEQSFIACSPSGSIAANSSTSSPRRWRAPSAAPATRRPTRRWPPNCWPTARTGWKTGWCMPTSSAGWRRLPQTPP